MEGAREAHQRDNSGDFVEDEESSYVCNWGIVEGRDGGAEEFWCTVHQMRER